MKTNNKSRAKIDRYRSDIYDFSLVVANQYTTLEQLSKTYSFYDDVELTDDILR